jgi:DNA-binding NtrC family response regulator
MSRVLVVDDEPAVRFTIAEALGDRGLTVVQAASGEEALARLDGVACVVTDLSMPGLDGLALLRRVHDEDAELPVIVVTARGSERAAVAAMKAGAYDYLAKPFDVEELGLVVARALEARQLRGEARRLKVEAALGQPVVGQAPAFRRVLEQARRVAGREVTVLVRGETGTGKELVASLLHHQSARAAGPLVRCNGAAIPAELAEAELFGHEKGAFTGAVAARRGVFAQAHGGTLVLDEVGELPLALQPKLLRALQSGEIQPVGGPVAHVDVRVVASTHRDLRAEVAAGRFREDLYFRLAVVELLVPPLRERREDIPALVDAFVRRYAARFGLDDARFTPALGAALAARDWPGNVRELENTVARLLALSPGGEVDVDALSPDVVVPPSDLRGQLAALERRLLAETLAACAGNQSEAARRLGLTRGTLIDKCKRLGLL